MEDNKRKGPGLFYGIMGVATLVVAIIGATFAYFSASTPDNTEITGTTAEVKALTLDVAPVIEPVELLVPQLSETLDEAIAESCVDANGNGVCRVYKITVTNPGSAAIDSKGTITLSAANPESAFENLKWAVVTGISDDSYANAEIGAINGMAEATIDTPLLEAATVEEGEEATEATNTAEYYVVVWLQENNQPNQQEKDHGTFTGTVKWAGIDGDIKVTSTFTVQAE